MITNTSRFVPADEALILAQFSINCAADPIFWLGESGEFVYVNDAACRCLGYSHSELLHLSLTDIDSQLEPPNWATHWQDLKHRNGLTLESNYRAKSGYLLPVKVTIHHLSFNHKEYICAFVHDIWERKLAQTALSESEERFRCLVEGAADAFFLHTVEGKIIDVNQWACDSLEYTREELLNLSIQDIQAEITDPFRWKDLIPGTPMTLNSMHRRKNGAVFPVEMRLSAVDLAGTRLIVALGRDISERERTREQLRRYAFYDAFTGLPNRMLMLEHLDRMIVRGYPSQFALLCFNLGRFEAVKYGFGHTVAEQFLMMAMQRLKDCLPPNTFMARIESDEFAVLLEDLTELDEVTRLAKYIQKKLTAAIDLGEHEVFTATSIGIVYSSVGYSHAEDFLRAADIAMHRAKVSGTPRYVIFDQEMQSRAIRRLQLDADLRRALQREEFQLHYQPIFSLQDYRIVGVEALLRWHHPQRGMVSPAEFIPVAEETGLIVPIGMWVLRQACYQLVQWHQVRQENAPLFVSVNLSPIQLEQPNLLDQVDRVLRETTLHPTRLKLEITESATVENPARVIEILEQLKSRNIRLSIDDFGTGYSSLSYLHSFPIDMLKVDRSFVAGLEDFTKNMEVTSTIIKLAHGLGMEAIAEGIETPRQLEYLQQLNCEYGQGFLLSRPVTPDAIDDLLTQQYQGIPHPGFQPEG